MKLVNEPHIDRSIVPASESFADFVNSIDDLNLQAQFIAPLWTDSLLLKHRPDPCEIAGYINYAAPGALIPLVSDDCLVISSNGSINQLVTITPVPAAAETIYELTIKQFVIETNVLCTLQLIREIARVYDIITFRDADIIDHLEINGAGRAFEDYIAHPDRRRPAFVVRRSGQVARNLRQSMNAARSLMATLGPIAVNDALFKHLCTTHSLMTYRSNILAFAPGYTTPEVLDLENFGDVPFGLKNFITKIDLVIPPEPNAVLKPPGQAAMLIWGQNTESYATRDLLKSLGDIHRRGWNRVIAKAKTPKEDPDKLPAPPKTTEQPAPNVQKPARAPIKLDANGYPQSAKNLPAWCIEHLPPSLVLLPRAIRSITKSEHPDPARLAKALEALAQFKPRIAAGERSATAEFHEQLLQLRLRDGFSNAELLRGQTGDAYMVRYEGRPLLLDRHLASTVSRMNDPRMIRIYYTRDAETGSILIGSMPYHLPTKRS